MWKFIGYIILCTTIIGYSCQHKTNDIITESAKDNKIAELIKNHGGLEAYRSIESIRYVKKNTLFDSAGSLEKSWIEHHYYQFNNGVEGSIRWSDEVGNYDYHIENNRAFNLTDSLTAESTIRSKFDASLFVLLQPFKMIIESDSLIIVDSVLFENEYVVDFMPYYSGANDQWHFLVKPDSNTVVANWVRHQDRYSLIINESYHTQYPVLLHHQRKSYFTDSLMNIKYLRAAYEYSDYEVIMTSDSK